MPAKVEAGIPNITGAITSGGGNSNLRPLSGTGAFYGSGGGSGYGQNGPWSSGSYNSAYPQFDARRCSAVFGNSDTVQPPAICLIPQIKY